MKIAFCLSSQLRCYRYCIPRLKKDIDRLIVSQGHEVDYFGSFSNNLSLNFKYYNLKHYDNPENNSNGKLIKKNDYQYIIDESEALSFINEHLKPKDIEILDNWNDEVKNSYSDGLFNKFGYCHDGDHINQWYYAERSFSLMQEYEKRNKCKYDAIIRARPDMIWYWLDLGGIIDLKYNPFLFKAGYVEALNGWTSIGDWHHFVGPDAGKRYYNGLTQRVIDCYNDMYTNKINIKNSWGDFPVPETIWAYCTRNIGRCILTPLTTQAVICRQYIEHYIKDIDHADQVDVENYQNDLSISGRVIDEYLQKITNHNTKDSDYILLREYIEQNNINPLKLRYDSNREVAEVLNIEPITPTNPNGSQYLNVENVLKDFKI